MQKGLGMRDLFLAGGIKISPLKVILYKRFEKEEFSVKNNFCILDPLRIHRRDGCYLNNLVFNYTVMYLYMLCLYIKFSTKLISSAIFKKSQKIDKASDKFWFAM
ncbi:UNVERIFIED_CONTAM: hypothetical protein K2H54_065160 [Gekko kuhli]